MCVFSVHCARQVCKSRSCFSLSIDLDGILNSLENQKYKKSLRAMYYYPIYYNCIIILGEHEVKCMYNSSPHMLPMPLSYNIINFIIMLYNNNYKCWLDVNDL